MKKNVLLGLGLLCSISTSGMMLAAGNPVDDAKDAAEDAAPDVPGDGPATPGETSLTEGEQVQVQATVEGQVTAILTQVGVTSFAKLAASQEEGPQCTALPLQGCQPAAEVCSEITNNTEGGVTTIGYSFALEPTPVTCDFGGSQITYESYGYDYEIVTSETEISVTYSGGIEVSIEGAAAAQIPLSGLAYRYNNVSATYDRTNSKLTAFDLDITFLHYTASVEELHVKASLVAGSDPAEIVGSVIEGSTESATFSWVEGAYEWTWN